VVEKEKKNEDGEGASHVKKEDRNWLRYTSSHDVVSCVGVEVMKKEHDVTGDS